MTPYHGLLLLTAIWIVWIIAEWWGEELERRLMMDKDFTAFDAKLLELIDAGCNTLTKLEYAPGLRPLATELSTKPNEEFRVIGRRLQAARRAGKIRYNGKHWERREP